jgi:DNA ligase-associated metallophosphoesterase
MGKVHAIDKQHFLKHDFGHTTCWLLPQKALYWPEANWLVVADIHLGKAGHFRKAGIPVPGQLHWEELQQLSALLNYFGCCDLVVLGDLFHSQVNGEWAYLTGWMQETPGVRLYLVVGNHDLHSQAFWPKDLYLVTERLAQGPFVFTHEPVLPTALEKGQYNLHGHIHPSVRLYGKGRQHLRLPCFHFGKQHGVLPAFGQFTGQAELPTYPGDDVYVVAGEKVMKIPT